jgi:hypothetical protein
MGRIEPEHILKMGRPGGRRLSEAKPEATG